MRHHSDNDPRDALNDYLDSLAGASPPDSRAGDLDPGMRDDVDRFFNLARDAGMTPRAKNQSGRPNMNATLPASTALPTPQRNTRRGITLPAWTRHLHFASTGLLIVAVIALSFAAFGANGPIGPDDRSSVGTANQGLYDSDDVSTYPHMPGTCEPNGEVTSDAELAERSLDDWVAPAYAPAKAVSHERGEAIQEMYLHYLRCERERFEQAFPPGSTPPSGTPVPPIGFGPSSEMLTYFSDRLRYDRLYSDLSSEQQAALDAYRCEPRNTTVLESFPLPVNQPHDYAIWSLLPHTDGIDELASIFSPADVYLLPDGRYGAINGSVSTAALMEPNAITTDDHLLFIAFVEHGGRYYIDEIFTIFGPIMDELETRGRNGTLVTDCQ